jgi:hypothetical protein
MKRFLTTTWITAAACCFLSASSRAAVVYSGGAHADHITLEELFAGGSIEVNNLVFDNWSQGANVLFSKHGLLSTLDPAEVRVTGLDDDWLNEGILFESGDPSNAGSSEFYVEDLAVLPDPHCADTLILEVRYDVTSSNAELIKDNSLDIGMPDAFDVSNTQGHDTQGFLQITENLMGNSASVSSVGVIVDRIFDADRLFDEAVFDLRDQAAVDTNITLNTGVNGDRIELYAFEQRFSQAVPEPMGFGLWALLATALFHQRRRAQRSSQH